MRDVSLDVAVTIQERTLDGRRPVAGAETAAVQARAGRRSYRRARVGAGGKNGAKHAGDSGRAQAVHRWSLSVGKSAGGVPQHQITSVARFPPVSRADSARRSRTRAGRYCGPRRGSRRTCPSPRRCSLAGAPTRIRTCACPQSAMSGQFAGPKRRPNRTATRTPCSGSGSSDSYRSVSSARWWECLGHGIAPTTTSTGLPWPSRCDGGTGGGSAAATERPGCRR